MFTHATATDSPGASDDPVDASADTRFVVSETTEATSEALADSLAAAEAVAPSPSPFDTTATERLPNTTDGENQVVR